MAGTFRDKDKDKTNLLRDLDPRTLNQRLLELPAPLPPPRQRGGVGVEFWVDLHPHLLQEEVGDPIGVAEGAEVEVEAEGGVNRTEGNGESDTETSET